jgi:hypothetical protein
MSSKQSEYIRRTPLYTDDIAFIDASESDNSRDTIQEMVHAGASQGALSELVKVNLSANKVMGSNASGKAGQLDIVIKTDSDTDSDTDDVFSTGLSASYGLLVVSCETDTSSALFRLSNESIYLISGDGDFGVTQDAASKYNVYWDTDQFKVQNKVGDNKLLKIGFFGV